MKKVKLSHITAISTVLLFSACSSKQAEVNTLSANNQISVYNIMGITEPKKELVHFTIKDEPVQISYVQEAPITVSPDIEFISYQNQVPVQAYHNYAHNNYTQRYSHINRNVVKEVEGNAKSFLGTPYVWGATGPSKFDCSGFTQWVYRDAGINIPRVSRDQARVGQYVSFNQLQKGDMMFFDTHKRRTGKVTHVGIYLGNGNFIHASSAGKKVVIYNFNQKTFYKKRFLWGRRVINGASHYASN